MQYLRPENAFLFRILHEDNLAEVLARGGLHCRNAAQADPDYVSIGNAELIGKRASREVPIPPGGTLNDYVPFYFTPRSIMMLNILTGYSGITKRTPSELVILVSSLPRLRELDLPFVFTNQHAYSVDVEFYTDLADLDQIDWRILQRCDFKTNDADPGKPTRYQAEALVHQHVPLDALLGIRCFDDDVRERLQDQAQAEGVEIPIRAAPELYFRA